MINLVRVLSKQRLLDVIGQVGTQEKRIPTSSLVGPTNTLESLHTRSKYKSSTFKTRARTGSNRSGILSKEQIQK